MRVKYEQVRGIRFAAGIVTVVMLVALLAGCGGSSAPKPTMATSSSGTTSASGASGPAMSQSDYSNIILQQKAALEPVLVQIEEIVQTPDLITTSSTTRQQLLGQLKIVHQTYGAAAKLVPPSGYQAFQTKYATALKEDDDAATLLEQAVHGGSGASAKISQAQNDLLQGLQDLDAALGSMPGS